MSDTSCNTIYLIGFMGTGKSSVSKLLGKMTGRKEYDLDLMIEEDAKKSIADIFREEGEESFRDQETKVLYQTKEISNAIISCGGGTVLRKENVQFMKEHGKILLLTATAQTVLDRVKNSNDRPILNGNMNVEYIENLMEKRRMIYQQSADITIKTDNKALVEIANEVVSLLEKNK